MPYYLRNEFPGPAIRGPPRPRVTTVFTTVVTHSTTVTPRTPRRIGLLFSVPDIGSQSSASSFIRTYKEVLTNEGASVERSVAFSWPLEIVFDLGNCRVEFFYATTKLRSCPLRARGRASSPGTELAKLFTSHVTRCARVEKSRRLLSFLPVDLLTGPGWLLEDLLGCIE